MSNKLFAALLVSAAVMIPGAAFADPPADRCIGPANDSPGDVNQAIKDVFGTPGQQTLTTLPANEFAHARNDLRKVVCPPPGQT